jgi:uncharacterized protein YecT (DUF1311 family)
MRAAYSQLINAFAIFSVCCWVLLASFFPTNGYATVLDGYLDMCKEGDSFLRCEELKTICAHTESVVIPSADKPTEQEKQTLRGCSSKELYYGYGKPPDFIKARKCAYLEIESSNTNDESFYGSSILMMIYANGEGVKQNLDLALKFACEEGGGQTVEYEGHILHLDNLRNQSVATNKFDFCDDAQSLLMTGRCADRGAQISRAKREMEFAKLLSHWSEFEKSEFEKLRVSRQGFLIASEDEIDGSGTMGVADSIFAKQRMEDDFLNSLTAFEKGKFPAFREDDFSKADRELNLIYKKIQNASEDDIIGFSWGTVTKEDIKSVQRAWLKYRDAWVAFAKLKYPSVSAASWKTWLTRERVWQLNTFLEEKPN